MKKSASNAKNPPPVERTQAEEEQFKQGTSADSVPQSRSLEYEYSRFPESFVFLAAFRRTRRLPWASRDDDFESCKSLLIALFCFWSIPEERKTSPLFSAEGVKFLRELTCLQGACQYDKKRGVESQDDTSVCKTASPVYQDGLGAVFSGERAAETALRKYATLTEFEMFAMSPADIVQSLNYLGSLPQQSFDAFPEFMHSTFHE